MNLPQAIKIISQNRPGLDIKEVVLSESSQWDKKLYHFTKYDKAISVIYSYLQGGEL